MPLSLKSSAFSNNGRIPPVHTCDGDSTPPPLEWSGAPDGTKSYVLIVDDPDAPDPKAPKRTYVHWVAYDLPASAKAMDGKHRQGVNDGHGPGYTGPCPPIGRHRYFFKLYALDTELGDLGTPTKADVEKAMRGHVLEQAELIGTYEHATG
jgi:hypothetical protein